MIDPLTFFKGFGISILLILFGGGLVYWIGVIFSKYKYPIKYKILRRKFDDQVVEFLKHDLEKGVSEREIFMALYMSGQANKEEIREMKYILNQLKKGGSIKNE